MSFHLKRMGIAILFLAVVAAFGFQGLHLAFFLLKPMKNSNPEGAIVEVHKGLGPKELTKLFISNGVVPADEEKTFILAGRLGRFWRRVKAGEYKFAPSLTPIEVFSVITSGLSIQHPVTVREGENVYEIAADIKQRISQKRGLP